jgi:hypothetical protein
VLPLASRAARRTQIAQYARRTPEQTPLYAVVRDELETYLARASERERVVPRFVERELRAYLQCGLLCHGFVRVSCADCGLDRLVAFSCKGRSFCPACVGRRMADTAAHLVDRVLPQAPVRQWVLSLPHSLRYRLAFDAELCSAALNVFIRSVFISLRRRARARFGVQARIARCGAVTFVQRFGDALNLNVHFHSLILDGVYLRAADGSAQFRTLAPPTDAEVERVAASIARRLVRLLERRGLLAGNPDETDPLAHDGSVLGELYAASIRHRAATGRRAGRRVTRVGDPVTADDLEPLRSPRCAMVNGVSLHANVAVPARDRKRLERLCRYVARPPVSTARLAAQSDGLLRYRLKRRWRDGTTHVVFEPGELLERLVALIPPPRAHQVRYHGVLAPAAVGRAAICCGRRLTEHSKPDSSQCPRVPGNDRTGNPNDTTAGSSARRSTRSGNSSHACRSRNADPLVTAADSPVPAPPRARRLSWSALMQRVFARDVLKCPSCRGRMRVIAAIEQPEIVAAILGSLGLASRAPPLATARRADFFFEPAGPADDLTDPASD